MRESHIIIGTTHTLTLHSLTFWVINHFPVSAPVDTFAGPTTIEWDTDAHMASSCRKPKFKLTNDQKFQAFSQDFLSQRPLSFCCQ